MGVRPPIALVTGFVPIINHPRPAKEYGELGENLFSGLKGDFFVHPFYETVQDTWLSKMIAALPFNVTPSVADNPEKNSIAYHCVQAQKFAWLLQASLLHPKVKTFVWADYGLAHIGITPEHVNEFMARVRHDDFAIPGCWTRQEAQDRYNYLWPCWRFCGGILVVPRADVRRLCMAVRQATKEHIARTKNVDWEVNALYRAEPSLPALRWYYADHNAQLVENYK